MLMFACALIFSKSEYHNRIMKNRVCVSNKVNNRLKGPYNEPRRAKNRCQRLQIVFLDQKCAYEKNPHGQHSSSDSEKTDPTHPTKTMIPKPPESKHLQMRILKDKISFQCYLSTDRVGLG